MDKNDIAASVLRYRPAASGNPTTTVLSGDALRARAAMFPAQERRKFVLENYGRIVSVGGKLRAQLDEGKDAKIQNKIKLLCSLHYVNPINN